MRRFFKFSGISNHNTELYAFDPLIFFTDDPEFQPSKGSTLYEITEERARHLTRTVAHQNRDPRCAPYYFRPVETRFWRERRIVQAVQAGELIAKGEFLEFAKP